MASTEPYNYNKLISESFGQLEDFTDLLIACAYGATWIHRKGFQNLESEGKQKKESIHVAQRDF